MSEVTLTDSSFEQEVVKSDIPVLVDFWAPWCGPCKQQAPILDELVQELEGKPVKIAKLNVDEHQAVAGQYGIMSIPTLAIFKNGAIVDQMVGLQPKETLQEKLQAHME